MSHFEILVLALTPRYLPNFQQWRVAVDRALVGNRPQKRNPLGHFFDADTAPDSSYQVLSQTHYFEYIAY